ncbi:cytochrome b N-terminal domain-containing protein [bacterium]|nr:cytochrome b N-terminal domain-containing protein [bacterium]
MAKIKLPAAPSNPLSSPKRPGKEYGPSGVLGHAEEAGASAVDWIDERTSLSGGLRWAMFRKVPKGTNWFYTLGSATMFAFLSQAVTGAFLAMYYDPSATRAYESIQYINNDVFLGEFVHGMHRWGSSVMVILIFLHMGRTFFFGAYKYPRELNWVIGVALLVMTMTMSFSGYLLPFDQRSYWATIVGVNINGTGPLVGPYLSEFLRMLMVPGAIAALMGFHLYLVAKLGTTAPPWIKAKAPEELREDKVTVDQ